MTGFKSTQQIGADEYALTFNFSTLIKAEEDTGKPFMELAQNMSLRAISAIFWAALQAKHPMTRDESNALIDQAGFERVAEMVAEGISGYMDKPTVSGEKAA